jgi:hypothetical protein
MEKGRESGTSSAAYPTWHIRSEKRWKLGGADRHGVNKSERRVFTFILSHTAVLATWDIRSEKTLFMVCVHTSSIPHSL